MINASIDIGGYFRRKKAEEQAKQRQEAFQREAQNIDYRTPEGQQRLMNLASRYPEQTKPLIDTAKSLSDFYTASQAQNRQQQGDNILRQTQHGPYLRGMNQGPTQAEKINQLSAVDTPRANMVADVQGKMTPADPNKNLETGYRTFLSATGMPNSLQAYRAYQQSVIEQRRAGATNVNQSVNTGEQGPRIGTIPPGFQAIQDQGAWRMSPIPGGPVAIDAAEADRKAAGRQRQTARAGTTVIQDLQRALDIVSSNRAAVGAPSLVTKFIPESDAQAASGMIESALSNVGLDTLQQMRENSPTGGALGQVPIQQQKRLEQVLGSLDITQRPEIVQDNLKRVINIYMDIVYGEPDQIQQLIDEGEIDPLVGQRLMERQPLSFDDFGHPVKNKPSEQDIRQQAIEEMRRRNMK